MFISRNRRFQCPLSPVHFIFVLIVFGFIILSIFQDNSTFKWIFQDSSRILQNNSLFPNESSIKLLYKEELFLRNESSIKLLFYEQELFRIEKASFRLTFHNHHLMFQLNLTSMASDLYDHFKTNSKTSNHSLKLRCLQSSKNVNGFHSICEIYLSFSVKILKLDKFNLIFLSKTTNCPILLTNMSDMIFIDINRTFSANDIFRFTHQWSGSDKTKLISWPRWPPTTMCWNLYYNLIKNEESFSKFKLKPLECSFVSVLIHSTSRELFIIEQSVVSDWLDIQYNASQEQRFSNRTHKHMNVKRRRLVPFEIAHNSTVCSPKFNNWISNYRQWHENISFSITDGLRTFEEQRNRIIELDVRFLVYEKHTSGIADRIIHLISTYFVALLTNRLFIFDENWSEFVNIMQSSLNYEQRSVIPWFPEFDLDNQSLPSTDRNYLTFEVRSFGFDRFTKDFDYNKTFPQRILIFEGHTGGIIHTITSNSSIYKNFLTIHLEMNANNIFGCLYNSLFVYKLSELIKRVPLTYSIKQFGHSSQQILHTLLSPRFSSIGIQIRAGDKTMVATNTDSPNMSSYDNATINKYQNYFRCAQDILQKDEDLFRQNDQIPIIFLLSDSFQVRRSALRRWQFSFECFQSFRNECQWNNYDLRILSSSNLVFHISHTQNSILAFQLGMFDVFLFSLCDQHIISTDSGFGRFPAFASLKQRNIYTFSLNEQHRCQNESLPLEIVGHHWSAI